MSRLSVLQLGPLSLPLPWLIFLLFALAGAVAAALLSLGRPAIRKRVIDIGLNALFAYFIAWKLAPLLTSFGAVRRSPISLIYLPGGTVGILIGIAAAGAVAALSLRGTEAGSRRRAAAALGLWAAMVVLGAGGSWLLLPPLPRLSAGAAAVAPIGHEVGDRAPTLSLSNLSGGRVTLPPPGGGSDVLILNFWATWCPPCRGELPEIASFASSLAGPHAAVARPSRDGDGAAGQQRAEVRLYAVNLTATESPGGAPAGIRAKIEGFLDRMDAAILVSHVLLDESGRAQRLFAISSVPTTVVIRGGRIVAVHPGVVDASWLRQAAEQAASGR